MPAESTDIVQTMAMLQCALRQRDDLLAMLAHELRNPLHALSLQLSLAAMHTGAGDSAAASATLAKARASLHRYAGRVTLLLDLVGRREGYPAEAKPVDLVQMLSDVVESLQPEARFHQVSLRFDRPARAVLVRLDPLPVEQIVENLLLNAFKHATATDVVLALQLPADGWIVLEVADNGRGIPSCDQGRVFGKHEVGGEGAQSAGTGLGLWIVRRLSQVLGGDVSLHSAEGQGCRFTVRIPSSSLTQQAR